jgi:hypothetical protein
VEGVSEGEESAGRMTFLQRNNLLTETIMKKALLLAVALIAGFACSTQAQILYRISGKGLESPSYIVGTYHLAPASFADSIPGMAKAIEETTQVCGELDMMDAFKPENSARLMQAQMLPEGVTLSSLFTADQLKRLNALLLEVYGTNLEDEAFAFQMERMSPVALSTTITLLSYMKDGNSYNPMDLIDNYFQTQALQNGKSVKGFETVDLQMSVLYGAPLEKQVNDLMCMVDHFAESKEMVDRITEAYFSQDLTQIEKVMESEASFDCSTSPEDTDILVDNRNRAWVKMMPEMMSEKPTLFVVGAAHLCGEQGVLNLLKEAGYTIEGVKE